MTTTHGRKLKSTFEKSFAGKRVLITGHTGFKGGWLTLWLKNIGAEVHGISLQPNTTPSFFEALNLSNVIEHNILDIRLREKISKKIGEIKPDIIFHLAAQPLVRHSYIDPIGTFETNALGTAYVLEACRQVSSIRAIICVTTDKIYENKEWIWPYRENDALGGKDPYSASKASAELIAASYQKIFEKEHPRVGLVTVRGGNIIGGGDWSEDRLIPDLIRSLQSNSSLKVRNPNSIRPWQHVLALCHGYLLLASNLLHSPKKYQGPWNFGPSKADNCSVGQLLEIFENAWCLPKLIFEKDDSKPEANLLAIDSTKANTYLNWLPPYSLEKAVAETAEWYRAYNDAPSKIFDFSLQQLNAYREYSSEIIDLDDDSRAS